MKDKDLLADAMTRARQIATDAIKREALDQGCKFAEFRIHDHRKAIAELSKRPEIIARAVADVAKFKTSARKRRR